MGRERRRRRVRREDSCSREGRPRPYADLCHTQTSVLRRPLPYADLCPTQTSALRRPLPYADLCPTHTWYRERRRKRVRRETNMRCVYIHVQYVVYMNMMYKYIYVYIRVGRERRRGVALYILTECSTLRLSLATTCSSALTLRVSSISSTSLRFSSA
jgi:hypothetical protein